ncbi:MAG: entericidin EcnA/B family protein [Candidatus Omnitrophica bacterium]|nr:entericidin EcnA/B family protein [Candidatus Omnitrophota bacterium]
MKSNYFLIMIALLLTTSFLGCNMLRGAGEDIENAGGSIQKTVDHND